MITLFQFHRVWGLPNASPFCMKLETYLRMAKLPYDIKFIHNPQKAPKGKFPFVQIDGKTYSDSEMIIDELKTRYGDPLDQDLTKEQRALSILIDHTFCERLYWVTVYLRWQDEQGWAQINHEYFGHLPALLKFFVPSLVRKQTIKALYGQGMGRHRLDEVVHMGEKTLDALASLLGEQVYFLGDKPSSVDATAFAFLANILYTPLHDPLKKHALSLPALGAYCERMWDALYSDFPKPRLHSHAD